MHNSEGQLSRWWRNLEETLDKQNFLSPHFAAAAWDEEWKNIVEAPWNFINKYNRTQKQN